MASPGNSLSVCNRFAELKRIPDAVFNRYIFFYIYIYIESSLRRRRSQGATPGRKIPEPATLSSKFRDNSSPFGAIICPSGTIVLAAFELADCYCQPKVGVSVARSMSSCNAAEKPLDYTPLRPPSGERLIEYPAGATFAIISLNEFSKITTSVTNSLELGSSSTYKINHPFQSWIAQYISQQYILTDLCALDL